MVALAGESKNCVGSGFDSALRHAGEVNSQEWESWVRHRVNQIVYQNCLSGAILILATKRNDSVLVAVSSALRVFIIWQRCRSGGRNN